MSELSVLELEAQHGELLPEREALGVVGGPFSHSNFDTHGTFSHNSHFDNSPTHNNLLGHGHH